MNMNRIIFSAVVSVVIVIVMVMVVVSIGNVPLASAHTPGIPYWGAPLISCNTQKLMEDGECRMEDGEWRGEYCDPCASICELLHTTQHLIYFGITLVLFAIAPVLLLVGGFMVLVSGGSEKRLDTGKKILTGTIWGIAIVLGSFIIINTFLWALGARGDPTGRTNIAWPEIDCERALRGGKGGATGEW